MDFIKYSDEMNLVWDEFISESVNGNFFHTRKFLNYHKEKFADRSLFIFDKNKLKGVLPLAIDLINKKYVVSHPGITFGGLIHKGEIKGELTFEIFTKLKEFFSNQSFQSLIYKPVPFIFNEKIYSDDIYSLLRMNAKIISFNLSSSINLKKSIKKSNRRKISLKKAIKHDLRIEKGDKYISMFWNILRNNLNKKYNVQPVHSLSEIKYLINLFPENIECFVCLKNDEVIAGVILFKTLNVVHTQYIASCEFGKSICALDFLFDFLIQKSIKGDYDWFNFGVSTELNGQKLNVNLYDYKSGFGAGSTLYYTFKLEF